LENSVIELFKDESPFVDSCDYSLFYNEVNVISWTRYSSLIYVSTDIDPDIYDWVINHDDYCKADIAEINLADLLDAIKDPALFLQLKQTLASL